MIDDSPYKIESERLLRSMNSDFAAAYDQFYLFVERFTNDQQLKLRALLLGSELSETLEKEKGLYLSPEQQEILTNTAREILHEIELSSPSDIIVETRSDGARKYFIAKKSNGVIFEANLIAKKLPDFSIKPISFQLKAGEITSIVGKNGNGKSTLLKMVAGEIAIDQGTLRYPEFAKGKLDWQKIGQQIAYISQDLKRWTTISTRIEHLHFTAAAKGIKGKANEQAVEYIITRLGLNKYQNYAWDDLSGGFKLRFELARQLVWSPKLLIMDEPLAHLDVKTQQLFLSDLRSLTNSLNNPISILLSSQNLYEIENISDNIIYLTDGTAKYNGPVSAINKTIQANNYLLRTEISITELKQALSEFTSEIIAIKLDRGEIIISTTLAIAANKILNSLIKANIEVSYFRNISNSTRVFFENE